MRYIKTVSCRKTMRWNRIGFVWDFDTWQWEEHFAQLEAFHAETGTAE